MLPRIVRSCIKPGAWCRQYVRIRNRLKAAVLRRVVVRAYTTHTKISSKGKGPTLLADGLWDNPNHFLRLSIFVAAYPPEAREQLAAVLRTRRDKPLATLKALGFTKFYFLEDEPVIPADTDAAQMLLANVTNHRQFLDLCLPSGIPAYVVYDTVLKLARHPQPPLANPLWCASLVDLFRLLRFYERILVENDVRVIVLSHPWKNEFAALLWQGLCRGILSFHLNGSYETMRIRRFASLPDYARPVECLSRLEYETLPSAAQSVISEIGRNYLLERAGGSTNTDINQQMAYRSPETGAQLHKRLGFAEDAFVALICCHVWYDFPHSFGMQNFTDFADWTQVTLEHAASIQSVIWLIKPHPTESWYGGFRLMDMVGSLPHHVHILSEDVSIGAALEIANAVITIHGTVAVEAAGRGIPVLCADRSYYSDWNFTTEARDRDDFVAKLNAVHTLLPPDREAIARAAAFAYLAVGPGVAEAGFMKLLADSEGPVLYSEIARLVTDGVQITRETEAVADWLASGSSSYAVFQKVQHLLALSTHDQNRMPNTEEK